MWFYEHSLISKKPYDPFYYTVSAFTLFRNGKLHLAKEIYNHAPTHVVGPKLQYSRRLYTWENVVTAQYCSPHQLVPQNPKQDRMCWIWLGKLSGSSFWESSWKFFFKEVNVCSSFPWILAVSGTIKYQFFPLVLENH